MRLSKGTKTNRKKLPNLISSVDKSSFNRATVLPNFFNKIQNSFKLLQQPIPSQHGNKIKQKLKQNRNTLSLRLQQLSKHKFRSNSISQQKSLQTHNTATSPKIADYKNQNEKYRLLLLPRMNTHYTNNSKDISQKQDYNLTFYNNIHSQNLRKNRLKIHEGYSNSQRTLQFIDGTALVRKTNEEIISEKQQRQQQEQRKRRLQLFQMEMQEGQSNQNQQNQKKQDKVGHDKLLKLNPGQDLTEWSKMIVADQNKTYDSYDRKLMQKIKIYRPKKYKFNHQALWK